jgi:O-antigen ligase
MRHRITGWTFAVSLNGFWLYLGALDAVGRSPRTATTGAWYALVGLACLACAVWNRDTLVARLRRMARPMTVFVIAALVLGAWFLLNVVLISHTSSLSRTFAALLVLWSAPTAVLGLSLPRQAIAPAAVGIAVLGIGYALVEWAAFVNGHSTNERFSPIARLDPISAAQIPALGAVALLAIEMHGRRALLRAAVIVVLVAAAVVPGSRGPIVAIVLGLLATLLLIPRRNWLLLAPAIVVGLVLGFIGASHVGSGEYLSSSVTGGFSSGSGPGVLAGSQGPISTLHIRREWWTTAIKAIPDDPIVGHGVAMFVDNTPEAHRMGVAGERTYPHNSPLESLYSLGLLGAVPYALFVLSALVALIALVRQRARTTAVVLGVGLWVFAFANANVSGEIGADAVLWGAGALAVGLYAETARAR